MCFDFKFAVAFTEDFGAIRAESTVGALPLSTAQTVSVLVLNLEFVLLVVGKTDFGGVQG